jgi:hypothetical protein
MAEQSRQCCESVTAGFHREGCKKFTAWGEPSPVPGNSPSMHDLVIADIQSRKDFGLSKYGTILQTFNGRDGLKDAYEEVIDLIVYLRQKLEEEKVRNHVRWSPADLDRCEHGRHSIDSCFACPRDMSLGNLFLLQGERQTRVQDGHLEVRIGTMVRGEPIWVVAHGGTRQALEEQDG